MPKTPAEPRVWGVRVLVVVWVLTLAGVAAASAAVSGVSFPVFVVAFEVLGMPVTVAMLRRPSSGDAGWSASS